MRAGSKIVLLCIPGVLIGVYVSGGQVRGFQSPQKKTTKRVAGASEMV
jgi:hypothetical protein